MNSSKIIMRMTVCIFIGVMQSISCSANNNSKNSNSKNNNSITKIDIVSMHFATMTRLAWSFEQLWSQKIDGKEIIKVSLTDPPFLRAVEYEINNINEQTALDSGSMDTRIACLIYRANGSVDSISIGRSYTQYNNKLYPLYRPLLIIIAEQLPTPHRDTIRMLLQKKEHSKYRPDKDEDTDKSDEQE